MNNDLITSKLTDILSKLSELQTLLCQEKNLLSGSEFEKVSAIADQKKQLITAIEVDDIEFKALLVARNDSNNNQSILKIIQKNIPSCTSLWLEIENLLTICKDKNSINGIILSNNHRQVKESIAILQGQSNDILIYGAAGESIATKPSINPHLSV